MYDTSVIFLQVSGLVRLFFSTFALCVWSKLRNFDHPLPSTILSIFCLCLSTENHTYGNIYLFLHFVQLPLTTLFSFLGSRSDVMIFTDTLSRCELKDYLIFESPGLYHVSVYFLSSYVFLALVF